MSATARNHIAITAADADHQLVDAYQVGTGGTLIVTDRDGTTVTYTVPNGGYVMVQGKRVAAASTATGIVGLIL